jgi:segregation and condensation protein B
VKPFLPAALYAATQHGGLARSRAAGSATLQHRAFFLNRRGAGDGSDGESSDLGPDGIRDRKAARVEAVLFVSESAVSSRKLAQLAALADTSEAVRVVDQLNAAYDHDGSAFRVERAANGYLLLTRPVYSRWLGRLHQRQAAMKLSPPAMETLTVVAYRQPITRADIEAVRGVQCTEMLKQLMDRGLVRIAGEDNSLGRPYLYETTRKFLEVFGLRGLDDLPRADHLRVVGRPEPTPATLFSPPTD